MLTDTKIKGARARAQKYKLFDRDGLYLLVLPSGLKSWRFRYQRHGLRRELSLGQYASVSLKEAREQVHHYRRMLGRGADPHRERQQPGKGRTESYTVAAAVRDFLQAKRRDCAAVHLKKCQNRLENHVLPRFASRALQDVDALEWAELAQNIDAAGKNHTALRVLGLIKELYTWAVRQRRISAHPVQNLNGVIKRQTTRNHARITQPKRFAELLRRIADYSGAWQVRYALQFLALTFVRQHELRLMRWDEIDHERRLWMIPAVKMKMRRDHLVPLSRQALAILAEVKRFNAGDGLVFPGIVKPAQPLSANTLNKALRLMGFAKEEMSGHGFRGSASTLLHEMGFAPHYIEAQLAHWNGGSVAAAYNHALYLKQRTEMMQRWADYLDELQSPPERADA